MNEEKDQELRELERHVSQLGEHFDTVRIIATTHKDGQTVNHSFGAGNYYAQYGAVLEWIERRQEELRDSCRER